MEIILCIIWYIIGVVSFIIFMFKTYDEIAVKDVFIALLCGVAGLFIPIFLVYLYLYSFLLHREFDGEERN